MKLPGILNRIFQTGRPRSIEDSYQAGRDCALNGPNTTNCHSALFASPEHTRAWFRGSAEVLQIRPANPGREGNRDPMLRP